MDSRINGCGYEWILKLMEINGYENLWILMDTELTCMKSDS